MGTISVISEIRKFSYKNLTSYSKGYFFETLSTIGIIHTKFDQIWKTFWPDEIYFT